MGSSAAHVGLLPVQVRVYDHGAFHVKAWAEMCDDVNVGGVLG